MLGAYSADGEGFREDIKEFILLEQRAPFYTTTADCCWILDAPTNKTVDSPTATGRRPPRPLMSITEASASRDGRLSASSSGACEGAQSAPGSPSCPRGPMATMSSWWGSSSKLPNVPSLDSVMDFGAPSAAMPAVAHKQPDATMSQLRREPRASVLERPGRRDQGPSDGDQLNSLLSELLTLRSAQDRMLAQPSVLKAACSLLPPTSTSATTRLRNSPAPLRRASIAEAVRQ